MSEQTHYREPGWFTRNVFNKSVAGLTRMGVSVLGSRVLEVRGRTTGEIRHTPVNLLELDGREYLVSPRGNARVGPQRARRGRARSAGRPSPAPLSGDRAGRRREGPGAPRLSQAVEVRGGCLLRWGRTRLRRRWPPRGRRQAPGVRARAELTTSATARLRYRGSVRGEPVWCPTDSPVDPRAGGSRSKARESRWRPRRQLVGAVDAAVVVGAAAGAVVLVGTAGGGLTANCVPVTTVTCAPSTTLVGS